MIIVERNQIDHLKKNSRNTINQIIDQIIVKESMVQ